MVAIARFLLVLAAAGVPSAASAADIPGPVPAIALRVVDGDTVKVSARIWVDQFVDVSVRLRGVDAPEIFRPQCEAERAVAREAKSFAERFLDGADIALSEIDHDKYGGRVVAHVTTASGADLGEALLSEGLAVATGAGDSWCA